MEKFWKDMGISLIMGLIVPALLLAIVTSFVQNQNAIPEQTLPILEETTTPAKEQYLSVLTEDGQVVQLPLKEYLTCVLLAEMPVTFEEEALKAQSVVARTYAMRAVGGAAKHEDAAVCTNSACCQGYMAADTFLSKGGKEADVERIRQIVASTDREVLTYEGKLIEATYFSCSGGTTEDAVAVWGTDVPYLQSVSSPGEEHATHYTDTVSFQSAEFAEKLALAAAGKPSGWFGETTYTEGGGVATMRIGGTEFKGTELRKLLGLRSAAFEVTVDGDMIYITTRGFGHRVGMSQYGADAMASAGSSYVQILAHYYQGTELTLLTD